MSNISLEEANLVGIFIESLLFGVFFILFCLTLWILVYRPRSQRKINAPMLATVSGMFVLAIIHLSIDFSRVLDAFIKNENKQQGALLYYANLADPKQLAKTAVYATQTLLGDGFVIYRLYIVWNRNFYICIVPAILWTCSGITGYGTTVQLSRTHLGENIFLTALHPWITSFFAITLVTNTLCTSLIALKIWLGNRNLQKSGAKLGSQRSLTPVIGIVVESGAIYSAALIALMVVYLSNDNGQFPALDLVNPLIGIVFTMIVVRVGLGYSQVGSSIGHSSSITPASYPGQNMPRPFTVASQRDPGAGSVNVGRTGGGYEMKPMTVNVSQYVHRKEDPEIDGHSFGTRDGSDDLKRYPPV